MDTETKPTRGGHNPGSGNERSFAIIVNGRHRTVTQAVLTFNEVVALAYPEPVENARYTITYRNAAGSQDTGSLVDGQSVEVRNGTIIDVKRTIRS